MKETILVLSLKKKGFIGERKHEGVQNVSAKYGLVHGRFQPFHLGHLEYVQEAFERCDNLITGITNADPTMIEKEEAAPHRHRADANPFTYFERMTIIRNTLKAEAIPMDRLFFVPFPIHDPKRWSYYLPDETVCFIRIFSSWEQQKAERFQKRGYPVEILNEGKEKQISGTQVRQLMNENGDWRRLVHPAAAQVIDHLATDMAS